MKSKRRKKETAKSDLRGSNKGIRAYIKSINHKRNQINTLQRTEAFQRTKDPDDKKRQQVDNNCQPHRQTQKRQKPREGKSKELKPSG